MITPTPDTPRNAALRSLWMEFQIAGGDIVNESRWKRYNCITEWLERFTRVESVNYLTVDEIDSVTDALRRGDISPEWEIVTEARHSRELMYDITGCPKPGLDDHEIDAAGMAA